MNANSPTRYPRHVKPVVDALQPRMLESRQSTLPAKAYKPLPLGEIFACQVLASPARVAALHFCSALDEGDLTLSVQLDSSRITGQFCKAQDDSAPGSLVLGAAEAGAHWSGICRRRVMVESKAKQSRNDTLPLHWWGCCKV